MARRKKDGPTDRILRFAAEAPGGVLRWREAEECYLAGSIAARGEKSAATSASRRRGVHTFYPSLHYHSSIKHVLKRHFEKVEGTRGYYVLKRSIFNDDRTEDEKALKAFHVTFGSDEFGMSTRTLAIVPRSSLSRMSEVSDH